MTIERHLARQQADVPVAWKPQMAMHQVSVPGAMPVVMACRSWGAQQASTAVLVHGWGESSGTWRFAGPLLGLGARVVAPDLPGFGRSACPDFLLDLENGFLEAQAGLLLRFLEGLHLEMADIHLVGHSMGATILLEAIRQADTSPRSLCLMAPLEYGINKMPSTAQPFTWYPTWLLEASTRIGLSQYLLVRQMQRLLHNPSQLTSEYVDELVLFLHRATSIRLLERGVAASIERSEGNSPNPEWVKEKRSIYSNIDCPTSLLWGTEDTLLDPKTGEPLRSSIRRLQSVDVPEAGHILQLDVPRMVASLVERHWSRARKT